MKNLKQKFVFAFLIALLAVWGAPRAEAEVKITIKNNRSHTISVALCWQGFDLGEGTSKGWYNVKAGETRTITIDATAAHGGFGYYAKGTPKGGKTLYWRGKANDGSDNYYEYFYYWIHPTKSFTGTECSEYGENRPISGGQKVYFRKLNVKESYDRMDGTGSLTFNN